MIDLSRLEEITDLRTVWPHEAIDFTPWLSQEASVDKTLMSMELFRSLRKYSRMFRLTG